MGQFDLLKLSFIKLERLLVFRNILNDDLFSRIRDLVVSLTRYVSEEYSSDYYQICNELINIAEKEEFQGDLLQNYLLYLLMTDENPFTIACEKYEYSLSPGLYQATAHDLAIIKDVFRFTLTDIGIIIGIGEINFISHYSSTKANKNGNTPPIYKYFRKIKQSFAKENSEHITEQLADYYHSAGASEFSQYISFHWDKKKGLIGRKNVDLIDFDDLIGYEKQKNKLIENTSAFLQDKKANNVLLYGDSGTGKSSSIKALLNQFYNDGLRLIEINKEQIKYIPDILDILNSRGLYFIIFMDDLSFEDFETDYKYLKAVMEGGIESKPDNVLFYATSNRRNIIKEKWEDRSESGDIHQDDARQEKLSLSERFGITITFMSPDQEEYLEIVKRLAVKDNLYVPEQDLVERALQ
ncbi:ATP-binding protein, partial [Natronospora cellulosivora (SeqCode)]